MCALMEVRSSPNAPHLIWGGGAGSPTVSARLSGQ